MSKEFRFFLMLTLSMILSIYIIESYNPSLPAITMVFKTNIATASSTVVLYLIGFGISPLIYAPYSDKFGCRPVVLFGIILALFSSILVTSAHSIEILLIARLIQGIDMGVVQGTVRCMVAADLAQDGNTLGRLIHKSAIIFTLMPAIAPISGGFMQYHFGWCYNLLTVVILAILTVILSYCILPETLSQKQAHASLAKSTK